MKRKILFLLIILGLFLNKQIFASVRTNIKSFSESRNDVVLSFPLSDATSLTTAWDELLDPNGNSNINFGVQILGRSPYERNLTHEFIPASNTKLFTAAAALYFLGPDYRIPTNLEWTDVKGQEGKITNLRLIGNGDPTWGMSEYGETAISRLERFAKELTERGVKTIYGPIEVVAGDTRWNTWQEPQGWMDEDRTKCYGSPAGAFNIQINCASFNISSTTKGAWVEPGVPERVSLSLKRSSRTLIRVERLTNNPRFQWLVTGTISRSTTIYLPVYDSRTWAENLFKIALKNAGIEHKKAGSTNIEISKSHGLRFHSPETKEILIPFLKKSINHNGETLLRIIGEEHGPRNMDLLGAAQSALNDFIRTIGVEAAINVNVRPQPGFFANETRIYDGSGLSRNNSVTTRSVMALLDDLKADEDFSVIWDALPIAGVDGTLRYRMQGTAAENVLRAKTGTLSGVSNLSGYVPQLDEGQRIRQYVPFVVLSRSPVSNTFQAREAQDRVGAALAEALNPNTQED